MNTPLAILSSSGLLLLTLGVIVGVVILIAKFKCNAFVALILAALAVGLGSGMPLVSAGSQLGLVESLESGIAKTLGGIAMIIGLGMILGKLLAESGAAEVIANQLVRWLGEKRLDYAVMLIAFVVGISVFFGVGIVLLGPISGAHFNPVVTLMFWKLGHLNLKKMLGYWVCQFTGAISGIWLTHIMFSLPLIQESTKVRNGLGIWVSELVSTLVLLSVIHIGDKQAKDKIPMLVALTVTAGYWFTSSTFFSNPAVAVARSLTNTFVGIAPNDVLGFVVAEVIAALLVVGILVLVKPNEENTYTRGL